LALAALLLGLPFLLERLGGGTLIIESNSL